MEAKPDQISLGALVRGAEKIFNNAEQLFHEAELLTRGGAVARALCLHQISLEECSKLNNIGAWAVGLLLGFEVDQKKILQSFGRHAAKNKSNAYMLEESTSEKDANNLGDLEAALAAFRKTQNNFHETSNYRKNASLYVDWVNGDFVAPCESITNEMLGEIAGRNAEFLSYAHNALEQLRRLESAPDEMRERLGNFVAQAEKLREEKPPNLVKAVERFLLGFLQKGKQRSED